MKHLIALLFLAFSTTAFSQSLQLSAVAHDFGTVNAGDTKQFVVKVTNNSRAAVTISGVTIPCGDCVSVTYPTTSIAPMATGDVVITLNTAKPHTLSTQLEINADATYNVALKGIVGSKIRTAPQSLQPARGR